MVSVAPPARPAPPAEVRHTNGLVLPQPDVLVPFAASRFDEPGNLHDDETREAIRDLLVGFAEWVRQLREGLGRAA